MSNDLNCLKKNPIINLVINTFFCNNSLIFFFKYKIYHIFTLK